MNTAAKNAGMASAMSSHFDSFREAAIMQPTITQHAGGCGGRHGGDDRGQERGQGEADRHNHGGQAGAGAPAAMPAEDLT